MHRKRLLSILLFLALAAIWYHREIHLEGAPTTDTGRPRQEQPAPDRRDTGAAKDVESSATTKRGSDGAIERAIRAKRSGVWVEAEGIVVHLLPDDRVGDKHQRLLLDLPDGHTIKISHNIDLAARIPVRKGDRLRFRGRFEWNDKGGVVHWTHHDPSGRKRGGWLELRGKRYE